MIILSFTSQRNLEVRQEITLRPTLYIVDTNQRTPGPVHHLREEATMFEPITRQVNVTTKAVKAIADILSHRWIYALLAILHGAGCFLTQHPEIYGPMAVLYAALAIKA